MKRKLFVLCMWSLATIPLLMLLTGVLSLNPLVGASGNGDIDGPPVPRTGDDAGAVPAATRHRIRSSSVMPYFSFSGRVIPQG
ncbi:MAG: hypothetical protein LBL59_10830 [Xanthomonadaceae bacterium]|jgi:hypothetical protein|nr:hypothetical protein [Xanthomonadaceae bacterium]